MHNPGSSRTTAMTMIFPNMKQKWLVVDDNDDDPSSSSLDVEFIKIRATTGAANPALAKSQEKIKIKKAVRFNVDRNESYESVHNVCKSELKSLCWYHAADYAFFKDSARFLARQIIKQERKVPPCSYEKVVERVHQTCCEHARQLQQEGQQQQQQNSNGHDNRPSILNESDRELLIDRLQKSTVRLGLDRLSIRTVGLTSRVRQRQCRKDVLEKQSELLLLSNNKCCLDHSGSVDTQVTVDDECSVDSSVAMQSDDHAETLRKVSEQITLPSRLYSREMALALAASLYEC